MLSPLDYQGDLICLTNQFPHSTVLTSTQLKTLQRELPLGRQKVRGLFAPVELTAFHAVFRDRVESCQP